MIKWIIGILVLIFLPAAGFAQEVEIKGRLLDVQTNRPVVNASVYIPSIKTGTVSDSMGYFSFKIGKSGEYELVISHLNYHTKKIILQDKFDLGNVLLLTKDIQLPEVEVVSEGERMDNMVKIDPKWVKKITTASGGIEAILKTLPGVSSNNELSSQYSVRGGNYDENLIYVNDVEIYRPIITRAGQQEGLSFVNPDMVQSVSFSAGGFPAYYGDKLSSVLDVRYKEPLERKSSITAGILGMDLHTEGTAMKYRFSYNIGARYRTNQYLLGALDTKGSYKPVFFDWQSLIGYQLSEKWHLSWLSNIAFNRYLFIPQTQETEFGTINQALRLTVFFEGQQISRYLTSTNAMTLAYKDKSKEVKWINTWIRSREEERFTIDGLYRIDALEKDLSKSNFGETSYTLGVGSYLQNARNRLDVDIYRTEAKLTVFNGKNPVKAGILFELDQIEDIFKEWSLIDSAGYIIPRPQDSVGYTDPSQQPKKEIILPYYVNQSNNLGVFRTAAYMQKEWQISTSKQHEWNINAGMRINLNNQNNQWVVSPRIQVGLKPDWEKNYVFRWAVGLYYQPPFYRELRDFDGSLNLQARNQQSWHFIAGVDHLFKMWGRDFKWMVEAYYKYMPRVIPYEVNDVRIRYFARETAPAYAAGIDMKINGEFVAGTESWFSLSLMQTKEDIKGDYYTVAYNTDGERIIPGYTFNTTVSRIDTVEVGYIPRPTDQWLNFGMFFQDYIPGFDRITMSMTMFFGSGLPFGPPDHSRYKDTLRYPFYRRADLGVQYQIKKHNDNKEFKAKWLNKIDAFWIGLEVFNLFQVNNTISYTWLKDVTNRQYAIPNYLTPRRINLKFYISF